MGERGPLPKPRAQGHREHAQLAVVEDKPAHIPPVPTGLTPASRKAWKAYWSSPVATVTDEVDMPIIRRLWALYAQHEKAAEAVMAGLLVKGSVGQVRVNPAADHMLKLESTILRMENELGLTPMARARLGIAVGQATATIEDLKANAYNYDEPDDPRYATVVEPAQDV